MKAKNKGTFFLRNKQQQTQHEKAETVMKLKIMWTLTVLVFQFHIRNGVKTMLDNIWFLEELMTTPFKLSDLKRETQPFLKISCHLVNGKQTV